MLYRIVEVEARRGYRVWVRFEDGVEGEVDLSDLAGRGVFRQWEEEGEFEKVYVDSETWTIAWPGGIDLAPDALYEDVARAKAG